MDQKAVALTAPSKRSRFALRVFFCALTWCALVLVGCAPTAPTPSQTDAGAP